MIFFDAGGDPKDEAYPPVPTRLKMYEHITSVKTLSKRNEKCLVDLEVRVSEFGLEVLHAEDVTMPISELCRAEFVRYTYFAAEMTRRFYSSPIDLTRLLKELLHWKSQEGTASLSGWRWLVVARK